MSIVHLISIEWFILVSTESTSLVKIDCFEIVK